MEAFLKLAQGEAKNRAIEEFLKSMSKDGPPFKAVDDVVKTAQFGDLIEVKRDNYFHWTFYLGDGFVLNFECPMLNEVTPASVLGDLKGCVEKAKLKEVTGSKLCRVNNKPNKEKERKLKVQSSDQMKANIELELKNPHKNYNIANFNCEHFATKMRFGVAFSDQIDFIKKLVKESPELLTELLANVFKQ